MLWRETICTDDDSVNFLSNSNAGDNNNGLNRMVVMMIMLKMVIIRPAAVKRFRLRLHYSKSLRIHTKIVLRFVDRLHKKKYLG